MTTTEVAKSIVENHEALAVEFFNKKASRLYRATYSSGSFGRMVAPLIKKIYPRLMLNGCSTTIALDIQHELEDRGYGFIHQGDNVLFGKCHEA